MRGLPALWGAHLLGRLKTGITELNRALPFPPNGRPFKLLKNPGSYPVKGVPQLFERVLDEGHWPDRLQYGEPLNPKQKFNLLERVEAHLPGSSEWLCKDLKRAAHELPHDETEIKAAIERHLARDDLMRLSAPASLLLIEVLHSHRYGDSHWPALERGWWALSESHRIGDAVTLTLLYQEAVCQPSMTTYIEKLKRYCLGAWTRVLRSPELRHNRLFYRRGVAAIRGILLFSANARPLTPARRMVPPTQARAPFCPIVPDSSDVCAADELLRTSYIAGMEARVEAELQRKLFRPLEAPQNVLEAVGCILTAIRRLDPQSMSAPRSSRRERSVRAAAM